MTTEQRERMRLVDRLRKRETYDVQRRARAAMRADADLRLAEWREAAQALKAAGWTHGRLANLFNVTKSTITFRLNPELRESYRLRSRDEYEARKSDPNLNRAHLDKASKRRSDPVYRAKSHLYYVRKRKQVKEAIESLGRLS